MPVRGSEAIPELVPAAPQARERLMERNLPFADAAARIEELSGKRCSTGERRRNDYVSCSG